MVKKASAKVTKTTKAKPVSKKPKGKVVKVAEFEDVDKSQLEFVKNTKAAAKAPKATKSLVDAKKLTKALSELKKFIKSSDSESEKVQLFEDESDRDIELVFAQKKLFSSKLNFKQKLIPITDKPQLPSKQTIALFVKDNVIDKELLDKIEESELNQLIGEIIPASELKTTYKQYEKRRELLSSYDIFLTDDGLSPSLPKLLGKIFFSSTKIPISIRVSKPFSIESTINQVNKVLNSVVYKLPKDNSLNVRLGDIENINEDVLQQVIAHFSNEELTSIFIKSRKSPAIPLYQVDNVYTEADLAQDEEVEDVNNEKIHVDGVEEDIEITGYEKALLELAPPSKVSSILQSKIKKSIKKSKQAKAESKPTKPTKPTKSIVKKSDKVTKPAPKVTKKRSIRA